MSLSEKVNLPVFVQTGGPAPMAVDNFGNVVFISESAKEIAHAINCHDELVEALGNLLNYMEMGGENVKVTDAYTTYLKASGEAK